MWQMLLVGAEIRLKTSYETSPSTGLCINYNDDDNDDA